MAGATVRLTWGQVRRWRLARHQLHPAADLDVVALTDRLCGIQAQVSSAARLAVAVRRPSGVGDLDTALADGRLVRTWSVRGTLHVLTPAGAASQLSLIAAARPWARASWQKSFATLEVMDELARRVPEALADGPLTREELVAAVAHHAGDAEVAAHLRSGWGSLLKPLAWQGLLCQGPPRGRHVTFARPDLLLAGWTGLPEPGVAGPAVVRDYLAVHGPATPGTVAACLLRGSVPRDSVRGWFAALAEADETVEVDVEGRPAVAAAAHLDDLRSAAGEGEPVVTLLPGFDQWILGPGTADTEVVPPAHRAEVSRPGGWISPVVLLDGRTVGTWEPVDGTPVVRLFAGGSLPAEPLRRAVTGMEAVLRAAGGQAAGGQPSD